MKAFRQLSLADASGYHGFFELPLGLVEEMLQGILRFPGGTGVSPVQPPSDGQDARATRHSLHDLRNGLLRCDGGAL